MVDKIKNPCYTTHNLNDSVQELEEQEMAQIYTLKDIATDAEFAEALAVATEDIGVPLNGGPEDLTGKTVKVTWLENRNGWDKGCDHLRVINLRALSRSGVAGFTVYLYLESPDPRFEKLQYHFAKKRWLPANYPGIDIQVTIKLVRH